VVNTRHVWVALSLQTEPVADAEALGRIFCEFGLYDALDGMPCVVSTGGMPPADLSDFIPAQDTILRLPVASCVSGSAALARLKADGFRLIADGLPADGAQLPAEISGFALDCTAVSCQPRSPWQSQRPSSGGPRLATGVDTRDALVRSHEAGFEWFSGNYALQAVPATTTATAASSPASSVLIRLLALVSLDAPGRDIESALKQDPNIAYQLLKLVNSVAFALTQKINSFGQALQLLGRRQLQRWLQLLLYAGPAGGDASPLLPRAALRAALLEALLLQDGGQNNHGDALDAAFMTGMFSLLDIMLARPLADVVAPLNLAGDVTAALLRREGRLGVLLDVVTAAERSPAELSAALAAAGIEPVAWAKALTSASHWAIQVSHQAA